MDVTGLGGFGKSFLDAYGAMHGMDVEDKKLEVQRKLAEEQARLRVLEEAKRQQALDEANAERAAFGEIAAGTANMQPHEITGALPGLISRSKNPYAAAGAAERYQKGIGGAMPWDLRERQRADSELSAVIGLHRRNPEQYPAQLVADEALRLGKKPGDLELIIPEVAVRADVMKAYYNALNKQAGEAGGNLTVPGAPVLPGQRPALPGTPGAMVPTDKPAGQVLAGQEGLVAGARKGSEIAAEGDTLAAMSPFNNETYGKMRAGQMGIEAQAKETPLDKQKAELQMALMRLDQQLKSAQVEQDVMKKGQMAADVLQKLSIARFYVQMVPKDDPTRVMFENLYKNALELSNRGSNPAAPRPAMPGVNPTPMVPSPSQAPQAVKAPGEEMIQVRRKADGRMGSMPAKNFNPTLYDKAQ